MRASLCCLDVLPIITEASVHEQSYLRLNAAQGRCASERQSESAECEKDLREPETPAHKSACNDKPAGA